MGELKTYRTKRNFRTTKEPKGGARLRKAKKLRFVIQKHAASHLHYDFRLEMGGVLKSWAVPKGPSLDPEDKRLAMHVEDHPLEYRTFEGSIPKGEYGAGDVIVWDRGTWKSGDADVEEAYKKGRLSFVLEGEKLSGKWLLIRFGAEKQIGKQTWLLRKVKDDAARSSREYNVLEKEPQSVISGKVLTARKKQSKVKGERRSAAPAMAATRSKRFRSHGVTTSSVEHLPFELATLVDTVPLDGEWIYEVKYDGYRIQAHVNGKKISLVSRNGKDYTPKFPEIVESLTALKGGPFVLDGEIVARDGEGNSSFQLLQNSLTNKEDIVTQFFVFDILKRGKNDLRRLPLKERRATLYKVLEALKSPSNVLISRELEGDPEDLRDAACKLGLEGIICKRATSAYIGRRTLDWVKVKCTKRQEFVLGGFTKSPNRSFAFGAILIGYFDRGVFKYAGKVGTGFTVESRKRLLNSMKKLTRATSPFVGSVDTADARLTTWIKPRLVAEVEFTEWTKDGHLRHPSFQGIREDKSANSIIREHAVHVSKKTAGDSGTRELPERVGVSRVLGIEITHPEREVVEGSGLTKIELAKFYADHAGQLLPFFERRPLVLLRCPGGKRCFFQKHGSGSISKDIPRVQIKESTGKGDYLYITQPEHIVELVQLNVVEFHSWGSRVNSVERPDQIVFDLDPDPTVDWAKVVRAAKDLRKLLEGLGLESYPKCTGGKGLHLVVPIEPKYDWESVKSWSQGVATIFSKRFEGSFTTNLSKAARKGKIFIDYLRNGRGASAILPFSPRARPGAPFSFPMKWSELGKAPRLLSLDDMVKRLKKEKSFVQSMQTLEGQALTVLEGGV